MEGLAILHGENIIRDCRRSCTQGICALYERRRILHKPRTFQHDLIRAAAEDLPGVQEPKHLAEGRI